MSSRKKIKLSKEKPLKRLTKGRKNNSGRNNRGRITTRHRGGGNKRLYRNIDFKQDKKDVPGRIETIEYDPYRTSFIAKVVYKDGDRRYIICPNRLKEGDEIVISKKTELKNGNRMMLKNVPVGYLVHNVEMTPDRGGQLARSAGSYLQVLANEDGYTHLKMPSGEVRKILWESYGSIGQVSNPSHNLNKGGNAGRKRRLGKRPVVRGSVMSPVAHPYGGGEGRTQRGTRRPKNVWGKITGGIKTRKKNKRSNRLIIKKRQSKRRK